MAAALPDLGRADLLNAESARAESAGLFERQRGRVFAFCLSRLGDRAEAEDATQTAFLNALRLLQRGIVPRSETAWMLTIADNVCRTVYRTRSRRGTMETAQDPHVLEETAPSRSTGEDIDGLREALASIPENQRRAILLREWHGLKYSEIAAEMGLTQTAVEMLTFRARRSLATALARLRAAFDFGSLLAAARAVLASFASHVAVGAGIAALVIGGVTSGDTPRAARSPKPSPQSAPRAGIGAARSPRAAAVAPSAAKPSHRSHVTPPQRTTRPGPATGVTGGTDASPTTQANHPAESPPASTPPAEQHATPAGSTSISVPKVSSPVTVTIPSVSVPSVSLPTLPQTPLPLPPVSLPTVSVPTTTVTLPGVKLP